MADAASGPAGAPPAAPPARAPLDTRGLTLRELGELFDREDFNSYPVVENGQVAGVVSKFDHLACFIFTPARMMPRYDDLMKRTVADIMTSDFIYVGTDTRLTSSSCAPSG